MPRLIDADKIGLTDFEIVTCNGSYKNALETLIDKISNAPTVDAVQVVRCKECKNWDTEWQNDWAKNYHYCPLVDGTRNGDWYCADAERKEE